MSVSSPTFSRPTLPSLLACIYRHIPRNIDAHDPAHRDTPESRRRACANEAAALACGKGIFPIQDHQRVPIDPEVQAVIDALHAWKLFGQRCEQAFPDREVWDESGPFFDPGYRYSIHPAGYVSPPTNPPPGSGSPAPEIWLPPEVRQRGFDPVVCMVSVLAPVYMIYTHVPIPDEPTDIRLGDFPERYHDRVDRLCALAEQTFGFWRLDEHILRQPLSDVQPSDSHHLNTILAHCLFTPCF